MKMERFFVLYSKIKINKIYFVFYSLNRTLALPKLLALENKNK